MLEQSADQRNVFEKFVAYHRLVVLLRVQCDNQKLKCSSDTAPLPIILGFTRHCYLISSSVDAEQP